MELCVKAGGRLNDMHKNRLPKRLVLSWIPEPRVAGGQEMTYGRSLQRHLAHFNLPAAFTEWRPWRKTAPVGASS